MATSQPSAKSYHNEMEAALKRLFEIAKHDSGQCRRVANFLLAWWDGDSWGHFPIHDLFNVDTAIAADMATVFTYLGQHPGAVYADHWGYRESMAELVERWRSPAEAEPAPRP